MLPLIRKHLASLKESRARFPLLLVALAGCALAADGEGAEPDDELSPSSERQDSEPRPEVGQTEQPLYGEVTSESCSPEEQVVLDNVMIAGRTMAASAAFRQCVTERMRNGSEFLDPYVPCLTDPYSFDSKDEQVAQVLAMTRSVNDLHVTCIDTISGEAGEIPFVRDGFPERIEVGMQKPLGLQSWGERAGLVWHEVAHNWSYWHDCPNQRGAENVPYLLQGCMRDVMGESAERCVNHGCNAGHIALISAYPASATTGCTCVRDAAPHTPRLGVNGEGDDYGRSVASGDFDGDGYDDLAIGAPGVDDRGYVFLYRGTVFGLYPWKVLGQGTLDSDEPGDQFGISLAAGNLNSDAYDDLVVGAPGEDEGRGVAYIFNGSSQGLKAWRRAAPGPNPGARSGQAVTIGRFTQAARNAVAIGAPGVDVDGKRVGMVYVYQRSTGLIPDSSLYLAARVEAGVARQGGESFGFSLLAKNVDYNTNDAFDDLIIGAPGEKGGVGRVFIVKGRQTESGTWGRWTAAAAFGPGADSTWFGWSIAFTRVAGPVSFVVGAPLSNSGKGRVYIYNDLRWNGGGITLWDTRDGNVEGGVLGASVHAGRSTQEFFVGAPGENGGRIHRFSKTNGVLAEAQLIGQTNLGANESGDLLGMSLALGDFDGDGDRDLASGGPGEAPGSAPKAGAAFVFRSDEPGGNLLGKQVIFQGQ